MLVFCNYGAESPCVCVDQRVVVEARRMHMSHGKQWQATHTTPAVVTAEVIREFNTLLLIQLGYLRLQSQPT